MYVSVNPKERRLQRDFNKEFFKTKYLMAVRLDGWVSFYKEFADHWIHFEE